MVIVGVDFRERICGMVLEGMEWKWVFGVFFGSVVDLLSSR